MNELSTQLDQGWQLAHKGDLLGAGRCAERAIKLAPDAAEAYHLSGYAAALRGRMDEALDCYRRAMDLDETYFDVMMSAAELLLSHYKQWDDAIAVCNRAARCAETDEQ